MDIIFTKLTFNMKFKHVLNKLPPKGLTICWSLMKTVDWFLYSFLRTEKIEMR